MDEYLGVQINIDHKIELFQDDIINYLMSFKEEGQKVKNLLIRFSNLFKNPLKKEKKRECLIKFYFYVMSPSQYRGRTKFESNYFSEVGCGMHTTSSRRICLYISRINSICSSF